MATTRQLTDEILHGGYDEALCALYGDSPKQLTRQRARYCHALAEFDRYYGPGRQVRLYSAPGRAELAGNHLDHQSGRMLAAAVQLDLIAVVARGDDGFIRIKSYGFDRIDVIDLSNLAPQDDERTHSGSLVRGIAARLASYGAAVGGFDAYTASDVLRGSGLSSSAAFEIAVGTVLNCEYNGGALPPPQLARAAQEAEDMYFGKPTGLMDQLTSACGGTILADFAEVARPQVVPVPFDPAASGYTLCVTDTRGSHSELMGEFAAVRREMEKVAAALGRASLREVPEPTFWQQLRAIRPACGDRALLRAMHYFGEMRRVSRQVEALRQGNFAAFLADVAAGGHSSWECCQNACSAAPGAGQAIPLALAATMNFLDGDGACRLQGTGFAGTIQAYVPTVRCEAYRRCMEGIFGKGCFYMVCVRPFGGIEVTKTLR